MIKFQQPNSNAAEKKRDLGIERFWVEWQLALACFHLKGKSSDVARTGLLLVIAHWQNICCVWRLWSHHPVLIWALGKGWRCLTAAKVNDWTYKHNSNWPTLLKEEKSRGQFNNLCLNQKIRLREVTNTWSVRSNLFVIQPYCMFLAPCLLDPFLPPRQNNGSFTGLVLQ